MRRVVPARLMPDHVNRHWRQFERNGQNLQSKILVWDTSGLVLVWKQLQQGSFRWPPIVDGVMKLSPIEFAALFDHPC